MECTLKGLKRKRAEKASIRAKSLLSNYLYIPDRAGAAI